MVAAVFGFIFLFVGFAFGGFGLLVCGLIGLGLFALAVVIGKGLNSTYLLLVTTTAQEVEALSSYDLLYIRRIELALHEAISMRG